MRTVDECPPKEGNDVGDSEGDLSEVEAEWSDSEGLSEGHHPVGVHDGEGETPEREAAPDHAAICLNIYRFSPAGEQPPQCNGAVVGDSDEEQEGCDQPPDLVSVLSVVVVREDLVRYGSDHP